jgi:thiamine transport system permease protein
MIANLVESKIGSLAELAYVEGASRWQFLRNGFWPLIKNDLFLLGLFVFSVCFGSFAVPLIVGGGKGTTIEVLIYEKVRLSNNWSEAVILALFQSLFIFGVSMMARKGGARSSEKIANLKILRMFSGVGVLLLITLFSFYGYLQGVIEGVRQISSFYEIQSTLIWNFFGSILLGSLTGLLSFATLLVIAYGWSKAWFEKFLSGYMAPSTALCCFAFLILGPNESFWPFLKIPLAFNLLCIGSLYRMGWDGILRSLENQMSIAKTLGANSTLIFKDILLPQIAGRAALLAGVASVWACGDYAVSRILAHRDLTLSMTTETLMSSYRLGMATLLSLTLVLCGAICFFIMIGVGHVVRRKSV